MEYCVDFVLKFKETMSILKTPLTAPLNSFDGALWKSSNLLSQNFKTICENAFGWNFTDQNEKSLQNISFMEWDTNNSTWKFKQLFLDFIDYLFKEHGESYCVITSNDNVSSLVKASTELLDNVMNRLFETYDKYDQMFTYYTTLKNNLLNGVKSKSEISSFNKFKDTPEGAVTIENLGDDYNTNVTVNKSESSFEDDRETPVSRLQEIENKLMNLYGVWASDFKQFFWEI